MFSVVCHCRLRLCNVVIKIEMKSVLNLLCLSTLLLQMSWTAGTQCVAKTDNKKPKPGELSYHKGDILTIVDISAVLSFSNDSSPLIIRFLDSHE